MYERERERERERRGREGNSRAVRYKIDVISSKAYRSVVRMTQVFDLVKCSISKTLMQVFKRENDLMQYTHIC